MCGIVGYIGPKDSVGILLDGLKRLEYRGYDSSGVAVLKEGRIELRRSVGKLEKLNVELGKKPLSGNIGIGHTRWATHGRPSEQNAHPHLEGGVAVVHNGIIENYLALKEELMSEGARFKSETDTEIISHLIHREIKKGRTLDEAVRAAIKLIKGTYALAAISESEPDKVVAARMECPLILGIGKGESILSSDIPAILNITRHAIFLKDGEMVTMSKEGAEITTFDGQKVTREPSVISWSPIVARRARGKIADRVLLQGPHGSRPRFRVPLQGPSHRQELSRYLHFTVGRDSRYARRRERGQEEGRAYDLGLQRHGITRQFLSMR